MVDASQFPVTFGYGETDGMYYYTPIPVIRPKTANWIGNYHRGDDRAMDVGTAILVNGELIGKSGNTGASGGPHLHIGRLVNGVQTNPQGGGFSITNAVVVATGSDSVNGNYIKIQDGGDGAIWLYDHLSEIIVTKGQRLDGMYNGKSAQYWYEASQNATGVAEARLRNANQMWVAGGVNPSGVKNEDQAAMQVVANIDAKNKRIVELEGQVDGSIKTLPKGKYQVLA